MTKNTTVIWYRAYYLSNMHLKKVLTEFVQDYIEVKALCPNQDYYKYLMPHPNDSLELHKMFNNCPDIILN